MAHSTRGTLAARHFLDIVQGLDRLGVDAAPVLAACGLARARLHNPFSRFDAAFDHEFWDALESCTRDPAIGLKLGVEVAQHGHWGVDAYIALHSTTLRKLFENTERFAKLTDDRGHVQVIETGSLGTVRIYRDGGYPRAFGFVEALFAGSTTMFKERVPGFRLLRVRLPRPRPKDCAPYVATFGVMPCFSSDTADIGFDRALLDVPLLGADTTLAEILKEHATALLHKIPAIDPLLYAVQNALFEGLERGQVGLAVVARATGTSARTLRRRLSSLGTSFREELDQLRHDLAMEKLRAGEESVAQIAERLGFASPTAFQRAFRRWAGLGPTAYRVRQRASRSGPGRAHADEQPSRGVLREQPAGATGARHAGVHAHAVTHEGRIPSARGARS